MNTFQILFIYLFIYLFGKYRCTRHESLRCTTISRQINWNAWRWRSRRYVQSVNWNPEIEGNCETYKLSRDADYCLYVCSRGTTNFFLRVILSINFVLNDYCEILMRTLLFQNFQTLVIMSINFVLNDYCKFLMRTLFWFIFYT